MIANSTKNGYNDFKTVLSSSDYFQIIEPAHIYTLSSCNIIEEIERAEKLYPKSYICILRGGGSPYDLLQFSSPKVCEAVSNSKLPVVIGVGHAMNKDWLLCNHIASKACITPSEAARFFLNLKEKWDKRMGNSRRMTTTD